MRLISALRLDTDTPQVVAFTGAGGKTSTIYTVTRELSKPCIITTTTHFGDWQIPALGNHQVVKSIDDLKAIRFDMLNSPLVLTGSHDGVERYRGLDLPMADSLAKITKQNGLHLLVEADGARKRLLKAPAAHEPVIPETADQVVVTACLGAVGQALHKATVHRPEIAASILEKSVGESIGFHDLIRLETHPLAGLKGLPDRGRRILHFTQADGAWIEELRKIGVKDILNKFHSLILSQKEDEGVDGLVLVRPIYIRQKVAGVVLAAGSSSRFGSPKQLLEWQGKTFIEHGVETALAAGLSPVIVVLGANAAQIRPLLNRYPVQIVINPAWKAGQGTSVAMGTAKIPEEVGAGVFLLVDQPQIPADIIDALIEQHARTQPAVIAPYVDGTRGNPVLFDRMTFASLRELDGAQGGRGIFSQFDVSSLPWPDERLLFDVDTSDDYQELLERKW